MDSRVMIKDDADSLPPPPRLLPYRGLLACNFMLFAVTTATLGVAIANLVDSRVTVKTDFDVDEEVVARGGMAGQRFAPLPGDVWQDGSKPKLIVAAFPDFPPYVTWNNSLGQPDKLTGFGYDFLLEACDVCDLDCEIVIDKWSNCWTATDLPGTGLQAGYYHGCATYTNQYQRQWSLEFSDGILQKNKPAGILSRLVNGVPTIPPTSDLSGFKICDVAGWAPTIKTLYYSENDCTDHSLFKDFIIVTPPDEGPDPAMTMLLNGECDGVYMYSDLIEKRQVCNGCAWDPALYSQLGTEYAWVHTGVVEHMANGTTLTMSKKGSGVPALVNPCIQKVIQSEAYVAMCEKHGILYECYKNEHSPAETETPVYFMNNNERDQACAQDGANEFSSGPHSPSWCGGCSGGYCSC